MDTCSVILTNEEAMAALDLDSGSFDSASELTDLIEEASFYIYRRTLHDWGADDEIQPLAKSCCKLVMKQNFFGDSAHDYQKSIDLLIADLNDMVVAAEDEDEDEDDE